MDKFWASVFVLAFMVDGTLLIVAGIYQITWLLLAMSIVATGGAYVLFNLWNQDERTEQAIDDASGLVIKYFLMLDFIVGIILIIFSSMFYPTLWTIGATMLILGLVLFYFNALFALRFEAEMS
ncbi:MAG: hypothetical protein INQ03_02740 [Candidatus Heimdallarchaeota archaeon]|nr:hypothetical protein [Candidatus Heimdallarchaeota archaeon]